MSIIVIDILAKTNGVTRRLTLRFIDKSYLDINTLLLAKYGNYEVLHIIKADNVHFEPLSNLTTLKA